MSNRASCLRCAAHSAGVFSCLSGPRLERLMREAVRHEYAPGEPIFYEGNPAFGVYCVAQGRIKLWRTGLRGSAHVLGTRGVGDLLGARDVLAGQLHAVTAEPLLPSQVCAIPRASFLEAVQDDERVAFTLLTRMAKATIQTEDQLLARSVEHVPLRTARFLLGLLPKDVDDLSAPYEVRDLLSRHEMALLIGTTPETLSRALHALVLREVIALDRDRIIVKDLAALRRIARWRSEDPQPSS